MYIVSMERAWTYSSNHTKLQVFWKRWEESFCHSCHWSAFFAKVYDELWVVRLQILTKFATVTTNHSYLVSHIAFAAVYSIGTKSHVIEMPYIYSPLI